MEVLRFEGISELSGNLVKSEIAGARFQNFNKNMFSACVLGTKVVGVVWSKMSLALLDRAI